MIFMATTTTLETISGMRSTACDAHELAEAGVCTKPVGTQLTVIAGGLLGVGRTVMAVAVVPQSTERT